MRNSNMICMQKKVKWKLIIFSPEAPAPLFFPPLILRKGERTANSLLYAEVVEIGENIFSIIHVGAVLHE